MFIPVLSSHQLVFITPSGDVTAPSANGVFVASQIDGGLPINIIELDENSTVYFSITSTDQSAATSAAVVTAGGGGVGLTDQVDFGSFSAVIGGGPYTSPVTPGLDGNYYIQLVFRDSNGNNSAVYSDGPFSLDSTPPGISQYMPQDGANSAPVTSDITIVFDESMKTANTSATVILKNVGGSVIETFYPDVDGLWSNTSVTDDTWSVTPANTFVYEADLAVQYSGFEDIYGNIIPPVNDDTTWNFTASPLVEFAVDEGASGGTFRTSGGFRIWEADADANLVVTSGGSVSAILVGGGGPGGFRAGGGGGAGEFLHRDTDLLLSAQTYSAVVGAGGPTNTGTPVNGSNTSFAGITVEGGQAGAGLNSAPINASSGSGGGAGGGSGNIAGGTASTSGGGLANNGGASPVNTESGGGGGSAGVGVSATDGLTGGDGGPGTASPVPGDSIAAYAGGGGGWGQTTGGAGQAGGGDATSGTGNGLPATPNTGSGGGGGSDPFASRDGGAGGSGRVVVWWPADTTPPTANTVSVGVQESSGDIPILVLGLSENSTAYFSVTATDQSSANTIDVKTAGSGGAGLTDQVDFGSFSVTIGGGPYTPAITSGLDGNYYMQMVFEDAATNLSAVYSDGPFTLDTTIPTVINYTPNDGANNVAINSDLVMQFNETMKTSNTSAIVTLKNANGSVIETFDPDSVGLWSNTVFADDTWSVTPANTFVYDADLVVQYSGFEDLKSNLVAPVNDDTTWNFTVEPVPSITNLLSDTEDFTTVSWTTDTAGGAVTASSSDTAPDSGADACRHYNTDTATGGVLQAVSLSAVPHNFSVYAKGNGTNIYLRMNIDGQQVWYNLSTGVAGNATGGASAVAISDEGGGWYRCSFAWTATAGSKNALFLSASAMGSNVEIVGDGTTNYINLWGAQLTAGATTLETYTPNV
jgi:hypothetical protein